MKQNITEKFTKAVVTLIKEIWKKRKNPLFPDRPPSYPMALTNFVTVEVSENEKKLFRIRIEEFTSKNKIEKFTNKNEILLSTPKI